MVARRKYDAHTVRRIAAEADRDPRSVEAVLEGRGRATTRSSVMRAIARLGLEAPEAIHGRPSPPPPICSRRSLDGTWCPPESPVCVQPLAHDAGHCEAAGDPILPAERRKPKGDAGA